MRHNRPLLKGLMLTCLASCSLNHAESSRHESHQVDQRIESSSILADGSTIETRFSCPAGYERVPYPKGSFGTYLRSLPLKKHGSDVLYFNGDTKVNRNVYCAVIDMDLDPLDLQQCADAVMRLRGEYLFEAGRLDEIHFNFLSDGKARHFVDYAKGELTYATFRKYMKYVFSYANTASLRQELKIRPFLSMAVGDVLIQRVQPYGHAVMVVDMCQNEAGEKKFMLAQSYMPAQDTQILINREAGQDYPWYSLEEGDIHTPEWSFKDIDLRCFDS